VAEQQTAVATAAGVARGRRNTRLTPKQITFLNRQLASMARLDMPLARGLKVLGREVDEPRFREVLDSVQQDLEEGRSLQEALGRFPNSFNEIYLEMLRAGEATGNLAAVLDELTSYTETMGRVGTRLRDAVMYPLVICGLTVAFILAFFWFLVPQFAYLYASAGLIKMNAASEITSMLPQVKGTMRSMFSISEMLRNPLFLMFGGLFGTLGLAWGIVRVRRGIRNFDDFLFRMPLFGQLIELATLLKISRTMRDLLVHGVSMVNTLRITSGVAGNNRVRRKLDEVRAAVEEGGSFSRTLSGDVFPDTMIWKLQMGEEKGVLEEALDEVSKEIEADIDSATSYLTSVISPIMLAGVALLLMLLMMTVYPQLIRTATLMGGA
jgi:type IV pilus assembly protein PilC